MTIYLYVKQHSITGLKYFGKTTSINPFKYLGSGEYWINHLNEHGKEHIKTLEIWGFDADYINDKGRPISKLATDFALKFSKDNNIVNARNDNGKKIWANLVFEDAKDGGNNFKPVTINGVNYESKLHACMILHSDVGLTQAGNRINNLLSDPNWKQKGRGGNNFKPVTIDGVCYESKRHAARSLFPNINFSTALKRLDDLLTGRNKIRTETS